MRTGRWKSPLVVLTFLMGCGSLLLDSGSSSSNTDSTSSQAVVTKELANLINQYRQEKGLSAIPLSASLTNVAKVHVEDLEKNNPDRVICTIHSWSGSGNWAHCCYTGDKEAQCMWDKPKEISNNRYTSKGYEVAVFHSLTLTTELALNSWKGSELHNNVIINQKVWSQLEWKAMGAAMSAHYAVAWFGTETDPAGAP